MLFKVGPPLEDNKELAGKLALNRQPRFPKMFLTLKDYLHISFILNLDGVAPMVTYPTCSTSALLKNPYFVGPPLLVIKLLYQSFNLIM